MAFTQGGDLGGLALGYYRAAPAGAPKAFAQVVSQEFLRVWANPFTALDTGATFCLHIKRHWPVPVRYCLVMFSTP